MIKKTPPAAAHDNAALDVALERAIEALRTSIAHRRGAPGSMDSDEAQKVWNEACAVFRKESYWPFSGQPWHALSGGNAEEQPCVFKSKHLQGGLTAARLRTALECGVAALQALKNHKLGLPAEMSMEEASYAWFEANRLLRDFEAWTFPEIKGLNWPGMHGGGRACGKPN